MSIIFHQLLCKYKNLAIQVAIANSTHIRSGIL